MDGSSYVVSYIEICINMQTQGHIPFKKNILDSVFFFFFSAKPNSLSVTLFDLLFGSANISSQITATHIHSKDLKYKEPDSDLAKSTIPVARKKCWHQTFLQILVMFNVDISEPKMVS